MQSNFGSIISLIKNKYIFPDASSSLNSSLNIFPDKSSSLNTSSFSYVKHKDLYLCHNSKIPNEFKIVYMGSKPFNFTNTDEFLKSTKNYCMLATVRSSNNITDITTNTIFIDSIEKNEFCDSNELAHMCFIKIVELVKEFNLNDYVVELEDESYFGQIPTYKYLLPKGHTFYTKYGFFPKNINIEYSLEKRKQIFESTVSSTYNEIYKPSGWPICYMLIDNNLNSNSDFDLDEYILKRIGHNDGYSIKASDLGVKVEMTTKIDYSKYLERRSLYIHLNSNSIPVYYINCLLSKDSILYEEASTKEEFFNKGNNKNKNVINVKEYMDNETTSLKHTKNMQIDEKFLPYNFYLDNFDKIRKIDSKGIEFLTSLYLSLSNNVNELPSTSNLTYKKNSTILVENNLVQISFKDLGTKVQLRTGFLNFGISCNKDYKTVNSNLLLCDFDSVKELTNSLENSVSLELFYNKLSNSVVNHYFKMSSKVFKKLSITDSVLKIKVKIPGNNNLQRKESLNYVNFNFEPLETNTSTIASNYVCPGKIYACTTEEDFNKCVVNKMFPLILNNKSDEKLNNRLIELYYTYRYLITKFDSEFLQNEYKDKEFLHESFNRNKDILSEFVIRYNNLENNILSLSNIIYDDESYKGEDKS
jgi:hypothetical protein